MAIGAQWYILFNAIAGAIAIPNDLREMSTNFGLPRRQRWRKLILPAIFPAYVTGGITAAGGAWNASIVAEVVVWGSHHLSAQGLGAYITNASSSAAPDHFAKVLVGRHRHEPVRRTRQPTLLAASLPSGRVPFHTCER